MQGCARLWWWEEHSVPPAQRSEGWLALRHHHLATLLLLLGGLALLWPAVGWPAAVLALPLARLMALDLTTHTLPDVYTVPLIAVGMAHAWVGGAFTQAVATLLTVFTLLAFVGRLGGGRRGLGGGDAKLILAMFTWLPPAQACFAIGLGCLLWLPFTLRAPRRPQPFGVPLALGWLFMASGLPSRYLLPI